MKTFKDMRKGDTLYIYCEYTDNIRSEKVTSIDKNSNFHDSIYINHCCFDSDKNLDDYSQQTEEGDRTFYATSMEALRPAIKANIQRVIDEKTEELSGIDEYKLNLQRKIEELKQKLSNA